MVAANLGPDDIPTCARNSVRPRLRNTILADSGMVQLMPRVRRTMPSSSATINTPQTPTASLPITGMGIWMAPSKKAQCHTQANRDIAELRRAFDRVAEVLAQGGKLVTLRQHADAVTKLDDGIRVGHDVGIAAAQLRNDDARPTRHIQIAQGAPDYTRA